MSEALAWLERHSADAPGALRARMQAAVTGAQGASIQETLADAAFACLLASVQGHNDRECALDLLSADALLTHACAAAAETGAAELQRFTSALNAARFQFLLDSAT